MNDVSAKWIDQLNSPELEERLFALVQLDEQVQSGSLSKPIVGKDVNNHIHTTYSFSPYSPSKAVWMAYTTGLSTAGIIDHDSVAGTREFIRAGEIINLPVTIGAELRASFRGTVLEGRRINNTDQKDIAYITFHGIPHNQINSVSRFFEPICEAREIRNRKMTERLNNLLSSAGIQLDYDRDIVPLSMHTDKGSVTERHLLFAVSCMLLKKYTNPVDLISCLENSLKITISDKIRNLLFDQNNPYRDYDLLGLLKSDLVEKFYILPNEDECPPIAQVASFTKQHGIILAYPYLGDVTDSVTGDKKAQTFEDSYLPELFDTIQEIGFNGVTYMPSRNTKEQLIRLRALCDQYSFFQISGEDINQPRQVFVCEAMRDPFFANLYDAAWALIGHEKLSSENMDWGMFSNKTITSLPELDKRITYFRDEAIKLFK